MNGYSIKRLSANRLGYEMAAPKDRLRADVWAVKRWIAKGFAEFDGTIMSIKTDNAYRAFRGERELLSWLIHGLTLDCDNIELELADAYSALEAGTGANDAGTAETKQVIVQLHERLDRLHQALERLDDMQDRAEAKYGMLREAA